MNKLSTTLLLALSINTPCLAQSTGSSHSQWQQYFEQLADYDDIEDNNMEDLYERLCELETSPINLNTATDDDLKQLSFLSSTQIEELTEYLDRYSPLQSLGELSMIQSLDPAPATTATLCLYRRREEGRTISYYKQHSKIRQARARRHSYSSLLQQKGRPQRLSRI